MNLVFKKSIILAAMTAMLTPQVTRAIPGCNGEAYCKNFPGQILSNLINSTTKGMMDYEKMKNSIYEGWIPRDLTKNFRKNLYTYLLAKFKKTSCFIKQTDTKTINSAGIPENHIGKFFQKDDSIPQQRFVARVSGTGTPIQATDLYPLLPRWQTTRNGGETLTWQESLKLTNDNQKMQKLIVETCTSLAKQLSTHFYMNYNCWAMTDDTTLEYMMLEDGKNT